MDDSDFSEKPPGFGVWFLSCATGFVILPFIAFYLMASIFGVDRRDSSSVWGLSGLAPILAALITSPAYFLGQISAFCFLRKRATRGATFLYATLFGIAIGAVAACLYWKSIGGGRILQAG